MTTFEMIKRLIGEVEPIGDSAIDEKRLVNLKELCDLTGQLIFEINRISNMESDLHSVKQAADYARIFIIELKEYNP